MGEMPWITYNNIPSNAIYNIDKFGNDTTKYQNKLFKRQKLAQGNRYNMYLHAHIQRQGENALAYHGVSDDTCQQ